LSLPASAAVYWHLLSIDAPTVAALWSWSIAKAAHVEIPALAPLLLALGTWLVYVADRILDGMDRTRREQLRDRHHFYALHRKEFLIAGGLITPLFSWIVLTRMAPTARREDAVVFAVAALYFLLVHLHGPRVERWLPKELAVGVLFAMATAVPAWARTGWNERLALVPLVALFAILCWLNCIAIENWEQARAEHVETVAHRSTRWAGQHFERLASGAALTATFLACVSFQHGTCSWLYFAAAAAAMLLHMLDRHEQKFTAMQLRVAADAALLTPLLFVAWIR
jgi:hypothetical protein